MTSEDMNKVDIGKLLEEKAEEGAITCGRVSETPVHVGEIIKAKLYVADFFIEGSSESVTETTTWRVIHVEYFEDIDRWVWCGELFKYEVEDPCDEEFLKELGVNGE